MSHLFIIKDENRFTARMDQGQFLLLRIETILFLFAFSTLLSWSYYGLKGFNYLFSKSLGRKVSTLIYQLLFLFFIVLGAATELADVIAFSDMMILGLAFPNLIGLYIFVPDILAEIRNYHKK